MRAGADAGSAAGDIALRRGVYLPVVLVAALMMTAAAYGADAPDDTSAVIGTADFNRDGIADIVEARPTNDDSDEQVLIVRLGQGDGGFVTVPSHNLIGREPRALVVGDFNGDGNPDVIVGDADGAVLEFLGDGKGGLVPAGSIAKVGSVVSIATGHFTHSSKVDLVVSDFRSNSAAVFLGAGDGSFRLAWSFPLPRRGMEFRVATADFNQDGISDLVVMSEDNENYEVMLNNGNGTFTYSPELSHIKDPNSYCPS